MPSRFARGYWRSRLLTPPHASSATSSWTTAAAASSFSTSNIAAYSASAAANCSPAPAPPTHCLTPPSFSSYCAEIASAIGQLHSAHIIYRQPSSHPISRHVSLPLTPCAETLSPKIFSWTPKVERRPARARRTKRPSNNPSLSTQEARRVAFVRAIFSYASGHIRLTDFGLAKESMGAGAVTHTFCGTPE